MKYCDQCGNALNPESKFCSQCGVRLGVSPQPLNRTEAKTTSNHQKDPVGIPAGELRLFIQANPDYYLSRWRDIPELGKVQPFRWKGWWNKMNWAAFFLGPVWLAYRKMYVPAILLAIAVPVIGALSELIGAHYWGWALAFVIGPYGNPLYRWHVEKKIRKIKQETKTVHYGFRIAGGVSWLAPIPFVILILLSWYGAYSIAVEKTKSKLNDPYTSIATPVSQAEEFNRLTAEPGNQIIYER